MALVALVVALIVGGIYTITWVSGGREEAPTVEGPGSTSRTTPPTPSPPATATPPPVPPAPRVAARPAYRSVLFRLTVPSDVTAEYAQGQDWKRVAGPVVLRVPQGGERACVRVRSVREVAGQRAISPVTRECGVAEQRTVSFVRTPGPCTERINGFTYPCQWYGVVVAGFSSASTPLAQIKARSAADYCTDFDCQPVDVGPGGRGEIPRYFKILRDSGTYLLLVDGVRDRAELFYR